MLRRVIWRGWGWTSNDPELGEIEPAVGPVGEQPHSELSSGRRDCVGVVDPRDEPKRSSRRVSGNQDGLAVDRESNLAPTPVAGVGVEFGWIDLIQDGFVDAERSLGERPEAILKCRRSHHQESERYDWQQREKFRTTRVHDRRLEATARNSQGERHVVRWTGRQKPDQSGRSDCPNAWSNRFVPEAEAGGSVELIDRMTETRASDKC